MKRVKERLASQGMTINQLFSVALTNRDPNQIEYLATIERVGHQISTAADRRNASLREIDRHRLALAEAIRRTVQDVEDGEFQVIESAPARRKKSGP